MKILVIGAGGREHALAWKLAQSARVAEVIVAPGNAGTAREAKCRNVAVKVTDIDGLLALAQDEAVALTVVGPEVPLVAGAYWKRANTQGALFAVVGGLGTWLVATLFFPDAMVPANLTGFAVSIVGMIAGTLMPEFIRNRGSSIEEAMARLAKHGRSEVN